MALGGEGDDAIVAETGAIAWMRFDGGAGNDSLSGVIFEQDGTSVLIRADLDGTGPVTLVTPGSVGDPSAIDASSVALVPDATYDPTLGTADCRTATTGPISPINVT